ncbi:hypothetical protein AB1Y20_020778 [Prymnesium parvum]|uniref:Dimethylglycine dehydrogenase n=1 Tax=Prymnesium parvum TaxID=97485 RepID=A0AB34JXX5_PRYPA
MAAMLSRAAARAGARRLSATAHPVLPSSARVVVVGGGIIGTSVAYHLAKMGWTDTLLLERDQLSSGTTWHAAGLMVTFGSLSETSTHFRKYAKQLYSSVLENETGQSTGFMPCGFIELATSRDYLEEFRRVSAFNRKCGIDVQEISPDEVRRLFPLCRTDDVLAGFYVADDGRVNPVDAAAALSKGARARGVRIVENVRLTGVKTQDGRVTGVRTSAGDVSCEFVVNAAGMWARQLGELSGVCIPNQAAEHYYLVTDRMEQVDASWPVVEDPSSHTYIRPEGGGLMVGLFEPDAAAWKVDSIPPDFSFGEIEPDWERMAPFLEKALGRVPTAVDAGMKKFFCGPESFTPDLAPIVGESPELRGYFVAAGLNSIGILTGPGVGRTVAHWIVDGQPDVDVTAIHPARLQPYQSTPAYRRARAAESLGNVYKCHYPHREPRSVRHVRRSPLHERLAARGACFREVSGWEAADWYATAAQPAEVGQLSWGRHHWFDNWAAEHAACRRGVALIDMSFMSKFLVQGPAAGRLLDRLATAKVDGEQGTITYTQLLHERGTLLADLTITKLGPAPLLGGEGSFLVVATDTAHRHVLSLLQRAIVDHSRFGFACVTDVTGGWAQINLQGPRSRELLALCTSASMSDADFPFRAARQIDIGCATLLATRITYVGELGYELFVPAESAVHVYDTIVAASAEHNLGLAHVGLKALGSLRLEKGYRDYGHDLDNLDTLLEAGLGFTADYSKPDGFVGMEATLAQKGDGPLRRRLLQVALNDPDPLMYHGEVVYRNGIIVGDVRAASYGHTLGGAVGLSMVEADEPITSKWIASGTWEVDIAGRRYPARASLRPMYDPKNEKIKAI